MTRARDIANFGDGIATADIGDGQITTAKIASDAITDALLPTGTIVQIVSTSVDLTTGDNTTTTSTSYVDSGLLTLSITPQLENSDIFVQFDGYIPHVHPGNGNKGGVIKIYRNVNGGSFTAVTTGHNDGLFVNDGGNLTNNDWFDVKGHAKCLDNPTYTLGNQLQYKLYFRETSNNTAAFYIFHEGGIVGNSDNATVTAIAMEIAR